MKSMTIKLSLLFAFIGAMTSAHGALYFYEPFTYTSGDLNGQGGWNSASAQVQNSSYADGSTGSWNGVHPAIPTSGGGFIATSGGALYDRSLPSTITDSFVSGTTTWLSYVEYNGNNGSLGRHNIAIGAAALTGSAGQEMAGQGIGVATTTSNGGRAAFWTPNAAGDDKNVSAASLASGRPIFVMAKIDWAAPGSDDTISIVRWNQATTTAPTISDWNAATKITNSADLDQSTFDTLSLAPNAYGWMDEIRIADDFESAVSGTVVVPEPSTSVLFSGFCMLLLLRRQRN